MTTGVSRRSSLLTAVLLAPASLWYLLLLVAPILIVVVFSFGNSGPTGGYAGGFTTDNYGELIAKNDLNEPCNAAPAISNGQLFIRSDQALWCIGGK